MSGKGENDDNSSGDDGPWRQFLDPNTGVHYYSNGSRTTWSLPSGEKAYDTRGRLVSAASCFSEDDQDENDRSTILNEKDVVGGGGDDEANTNAGRTVSGESGSGSDQQGSPLLHGRLRTRTNRFDSISQVVIEEEDYDSKRSSRNSSSVNSFSLESSKRVSNSSSLSNANNSSSNSRIKELSKANLELSSSSSSSPNRPSSSTRRSISTVSEGTMNIIRDRVTSDATGSTGTYPPSHHHTKHDSSSTSASNASSHITDTFQNPMQQPKKDSFGGKMTSSPLKNLLASASTTTTTKHRRRASSSSSNANSSTTNTMNSNFGAFSAETTSRVRRHSLHEMERNRRPFEPEGLLRKNRMSSCRDLLSMIHQCQEGVTTNEAKEVHGSQQGLQKNSLSSSNRKSENSLINNADVSGWFRVDDKYCRSPRPFFVHRGGDQLITTVLPSSVWLEQGSQWRYQILGIPPPIHGSWLKGIHESFKDFIPSQKKLLLANTSQEEENEEQYGRDENENGATGENVVEGKISHYQNEQRARTTTRSLLAKKSQKDKQWVVRVHPASGNVFYYNKQVLVSTWSDPFDTKLQKQKELEEKKEIHHCLVELVGPLSVSSNLKLHSQGQLMMSAFDGTAAAGKRRPRSSHNKNGSFRSTKKKMRFPKNDLDYLEHSHSRSSEVLLCKYRIHNWLFDNNFCSEETHSVMRRQVLADLYSIENGGPPSENDLEGKKRQERYINAYLAHEEKALEERRRRFYKSSMFVDRALLQRALLHWPEYVNASSLPFSVPEKCLVKLFLPKKYERAAGGSSTGGGRGGLASDGSVTPPHIRGSRHHKSASTRIMSRTPDLDIWTTFEATLDTTIEDLMRIGFKRLTRHMQKMNRTNKNHDKNNGAGKDATTTTTTTTFDINKYVLKVPGKHSFFIHPNLRLCDFEYVRETFREDCQSIPRVDYEMNGGHLGADFDEYGNNNSETSVRQRKDIASSVRNSERAGDAGQSDSLGAGSTTGGRGGVSSGMSKKKTTTNRKESTGSNSSQDTNNSGANATVFHRHTLTSDSDVNASQLMAIQTVKGVSRLSLVLMRITEEEQEEIDLLKSYPLGSVHGGEGCLKKQDRFSLWGSGLGDAYFARRRRISKKRRLRDSRQRSEALQSLLNTDFNNASASSSSSSSTISSSKKTSGNEKSSSSSFIGEQQKTKLENGTNGPKAGLMSDAAVVGNIGTKSGRSLSGNERNIGGLNLAGSDGEFSLVESLIRIEDSSGEEEDDFDQNDDERHQSGEGGTGGGGGIDINQLLASQLATLEEEEIAEEQQKGLLLETKTKTTKPIMRSSGRRSSQRAMTLEEEIEALDEDSREEFLDKLDQSLRTSSARMLPSSRIMSQAGAEMRVRLELNHHKQVTKMKEQKKRRFSIQRTSLSSTMGSDASSMIPKIIDGKIVMGDGGGVADGKNENVQDDDNAVHTTPLASQDDERKKKKKKKNGLTHNNNNENQISNNGRGGSGVNSGGGANQMFFDDGGIFNPYHGLDWAAGPGDFVENISALSVALTQSNVILKSGLKWPFRVKIRSVENLSPHVIQQGLSSRYKDRAICFANRVILHVECCLYYGSGLLDETIVLRSPGTVYCPKNNGTKAQWKAKWLYCATQVKKTWDHMTYASLPACTRVTFNLIATAGEKDKNGTIPQVILGVAAMPLVDFWGRVRTRGNVQLRMHRYYWGPELPTTDVAFMPCRGNTRRDAVCLNVSFDKFPLPVVDLHPSLRYQLDQVTSREKMLKARAKRTQYERERYRESQKESMMQRQDSFMVTTQMHTRQIRKMSTAVPSTSMKGFKNNGTANLSFMDSENPERFKEARALLQQATGGQQQKGSASTTSAAAPSFSGGDQLDLQNTRNKRKKRKKRRKKRVTVIVSELTRNEKERLEQLARAPPVLANPFNRSKGRFLGSFFTHSSSGVGNSQKFAKEEQTKSYSPFGYSPFSSSSSSQSQSGTSQDTILNCSTDDKPDKKSTIAMRYQQNRSFTQDRYQSGVGEVSHHDMVYESFQNEKTKPSFIVNRSDRSLLWRKRRHCLRDPRLLPKVLLAVSWSDPEQVAEMHDLLRVWAPIRPESALELLSLQFADPVVRGYAVRHLARLQDSDLSEILLQLVQVLKFELYHDSPLFRFLLRRALRNPTRIGHRLYWHLKSEMHSEFTAERYGLLLELYVTHCGLHREQLRAQMKVNIELAKITKKAMRAEKKERTRVAREELQKLISRKTLPSQFVCSLNPQFTCQGIRVEKCKVMDSKQAPLWVVLINADSHGEDLPIIFKDGDDLRQDLITLQIIRIINIICLQKGLDLRLNPYGCVCTGNEMGIIEVVKNSDTVARMQWALDGAQGAFAKQPIYEFMKKHNSGTSSMKRAIESFTRSCAGYCVTTYCLGIGDRHPSNIMMTKDGHLFHIDFGHFLGNFKSKKILGVRFMRERAPLVFTQQMKYVMTNEEQDPDRVGKKFDRFLDICFDAFNVLRANAALLMNLFALMVPAGIPELKQAGAVGYLLDKLELDKTDDEAQNVMMDQLKNALATKSKQYDDWFHAQRHM
eukprot:g2681.t1